MAILALKGTEVFYGSLSAPARLWMRPFEVKRALALDEVYRLRRGRAEVLRRGRALKRCSNSSNLASCRSRVHQALMLPRSTFLRCTR